MEADDYMAIMNLASQYAHALDECDWDKLGTCFTSDAVVEFTAQPEPLRGRQAIVELYPDGSQAVRRHAARHRHPERASRW